MKIRIGVWEDFVCRLEELTGDKKTLRVQYAVRLGVCDLMTLVISQLPYCKYVRTIAGRLKKLVWIDFKVCKPVTVVICHCSYNLWVVNKSNY
jgi:hypothetical protein